MELPLDHGREVVADVLDHVLDEGLAAGRAGVVVEVEADSQDLRVELVERRALRGLVLDGTVSHSLVLAALLFETWRP
jgi:hypothetical protein